MKQISLGDGSELVTKRTRKRQFLEEMERVVPWSELVPMIEQHVPRSRTGRPPFAVQTMLRIHFLQQWFALSDPAMEEALHDVPLYREFAQLDAGMTRMPDESTILRFRHLLEQHNLAIQLLASINATLARAGLMLKTGTMVDATLIAAPSSTKNESGERDPQMKQTKKGNQWYFGMKARVGADACSGLVHTVVGTAANVNDVTVADALLHGEESDAFGDAGYQGAHKRPEALERDRQRARSGSGPVRWHVAMKPGKRKQLDADRPLEAILESLERVKASIRARVEHPFRVLKQQFGYCKVRYRGLVKNTAQLTTLFALGNLWMARHRFAAMTPQVRP